LQVFTSDECERIIALGHLHPLQQGKTEHTSSSFQSVAVANPVRRAWGIAVAKSNPEWEWVYTRLVDAVVDQNKQFWQHNIGEHKDVPLVEHIQFQMYNSSELGHYDWHLDTGVGCTNCTHAHNHTHDHPHAHFRSLADWRLANSVSLYSSLMKTPMKAATCCFEVVAST
jgi:hypothetical protein